MKRLLPRNKVVWIVTVSAVAMICGVTACGKKDPPAGGAPPAPKPAVQAAKQPEKAVQASMSASKKNVTTAASPGNQFDFSNKKDPFKPDIAVKALTAAQSVDSRRRAVASLPIHSFDISQFKLIGIISGGKESQAMVVDPSGKGYVLKQGMTIGKNEGRIVAINSGGVDVVEQFRDDNGRTRKENIRLTLPRKQ